MHRKQLLFDICHKFHWLWSHLQRDLNIFYSERMLSMKRFLYKKCHYSRGARIKLQIARRGLARSYDILQWDYTSSLTHAINRFNQFQNFNSRSMLLSIVHLRLGFNFFGWHLNVLFYSCNAMNSQSLSNHRQILLLPHMPFHFEWKQRNCISYIIYDFVADFTLSANIWFDNVNNRHFSTCFMISHNTLLLFIKVSGKETIKKRISRLEMNMLVRWKEKKMATFLCVVHKIRVKLNFSQ